MQSPKRIPYAYCSNPSLNPTKVEFACMCAIRKVIWFCRYTHLAVTFGFVASHSPLEISRINVSSQVIAINSLDCVLNYNIVCKLFHLKKKSSLNAGGISLIFFLLRSRAIELFEKKTKNTKPLWPVIKNLWPVEKKKHFGL